MLILTIRLTPVTLTLVGRPGPYCPDARLLNTNISCKFRENRMMGKGQKGCHEQTPGRTPGQDSSYIYQVADKNGDFIKNGDLASLEVVSHVHLVPRPTKKIPNYPTRGGLRGGGVSIKLSKLFDLNIKISVFFK